MEKTAVSFPGLGFEFQVGREAFTIFGIDVYWYGLIIAVGIVLCVVLAMLHCKKQRFTQDLVSDIIIVAIPCAIVGARLYYVACEWDMYKDDLKSIFDTRAGGLAVLGGIIAAVIGVWVMCRVKKIPFAKVVDFGIVYVPLGQAIGRWGNFFNQEAFGTTTDLPWGMTSPEVVSYLKANCPYLDSSLPVHPTFLYESLANFALFFILMLVRKYSKHDYETACTYMIVYGVARFFIEGIRTDSLYFMNTGIRTSQLVSFIMVLVGLVYICYANIKNTKKSELPEKCFEESKLSDKKVKSGAN